MTADYEVGYDQENEFDQFGSEWVDETDITGENAWSDESVEVAKRKHVIDVVEGLNMFREIKIDQIPAGALVLDPMFVLAERENEHGRAVLKARLCARDFAKRV